MSSGFQKKVPWNRIAEAVGLVGGLLAIVSPMASDLVPEQNKLWVSSIGAALFFGTLCWLGRHYIVGHIVSAVRWMSGSLTVLSPWLSVLAALLAGATLFVCWRIYLNVRRPEKPVPVVSEQAVSISLDIEKGAIFNSWEHQPQQQRYIEATGKDGEPTWGSDGPKIVYFSYEVNPKAQSYAPDASSGGYITFYAKPFDLNAYSELRFELKVTDSEGQPDVGVRLAVDDPDAQDERERVTYELSSLKPYFMNQPAPNGMWQSYKVKIGDFRQTRFKPPLPEGISQSHINKLVFFVNVAMVKHCPKGKLWFKEVTLLPKEVTLFP